VLFEREFNLGCSFVKKKKSMDSFGREFNLAFNLKLRVLVFILNLKAKISNEERIKIKLINIPIGLIKNQFSILGKSYIIDYPLFSCIKYEFLSHACKSLRTSSTSS